MFPCMYIQTRIYVSKNALLIIVCNCFEFILQTWNKLEFYLIILLFVADDQKVNHKLVKKVHNP